MEFKKPVIGLWALEEMRESRLFFVFSIRIPPARWNSRFYWPKVARDILSLTQK